MTNKTNKTKTTTTPVADHSDLASNLPDDLLEAPARGGATAAMTAPHVVEL